MDLFYSTSKPLKFNVSFIRVKNELKNAKYFVVVENIVCNITE